MVKKQNLSILTLNMGPGGAQKVIGLLLQKLVLEYNVTLVQLYKDAHFDIPDGVECIVLNKSLGGARNTIQRFMDFISFCVTYHRIIKKRKIEVSVAFLAFPNIVSGILAPFNKKCKMIISERGFPSDNTTKKLSLFISKFAYPLFYNRCHSLFSNSVHINDDLKNNFGVKIPMDVIYNPIVLPEVTNESNTKKAKENLQIISVGTVNTRKNHGMILRAMAEIPENNFSFSLLGNGHLLETLKHKAVELKLEHRVTFYGNTKNIAPHLLAHDCFVLSSFTEGFPNALLEAMSYGLPCISTNCLSGPLEMLNENEAIELKEGSFVEAKYGILIKNGDHLALSKALQFLQLHPEKLAFYGKMSLERAATYELDRIYDQFKTFIHS